MRIEETTNGDYLDLSSDNDLVIAIDNSKCIVPLEITWVQAGKLIDALKKWRETGEIED